MHPFSYLRAADEKQATAVMTKEPDSSFLAGGTTIIDLMKLNVMRPAKLVDIARLNLSEITRTGDKILIGATTSNTEVATNPLIQELFPILSEAILSGASQQLRNKATVGGNLLQRTRCPYYRNETFPCNKRAPGTGCPAIEGFSRLHAIFGGSDHCISVQPSDMCTALMALDAQVHITGPKGERAVPLNEFFLLPEDHPERETVLAHGELITAVELPAEYAKFAKNSHYLKVRDRSSFSFALVSVAACLDIQKNIIKDARISLGGVATRQMRLPDCEKLLIGKEASPDLFGQVAAKAVTGAKTAKHNQFKVELTKRCVARALAQAAGGRHE